MLNRIYKVSPFLALIVFLIILCIPIHGHEHYCKQYSLHIDFSQMAFMKISSFNRISPL